MLPQSQKSPQVSEEKCCSLKRDCEGIQCVRGLASSSTGKAFLRKTRVYKTPPQKVGTRLRAVSTTVRGRFAFSGARNSSIESTVCILGAL